MRTTAIKSSSLIVVAVAMIATMIVPASAASRSVQDQMAANSAAWHVAHAAGDKATCDRLHQANQALANKAAGSSGSSKFDKSKGTWDITTSSGSKITSSSSHKNGGKSHDISYTTTTSDGKVSSSHDKTYTSSSIDAYKQHGGTNSGLEAAYNKDASTTMNNQHYANNNPVTTAQEEADVAQALLGLSNAETEKLRKDLEANKQAFESARAAYDAAMAAGNKAAAAAAKDKMLDAHNAAQEVRAQHNYTADANNAQNGSFYDDWGNASSNKPSPGFYENNNFTVATTYEITATSNGGGSISPNGTYRIKEGASKTFSMTPNSGYKIEKVIVDGVNKGAVPSYTFSNITSAHSISAFFVPSGTVDMLTPSVTDANGGKVNGAAGNDGIKSGYGIFAKVPASYSDVTDVKVVMTYNFGGGQKSVVLNETSHGVFEYPVNAQSPLNKRCVYIPVETADGSYTLTFTMTAKNAAGEVLTETQTSTVVVNGNMYEDDFTADS